jgi:hypothetical protein
MPPRLPKPVPVLLALVLLLGPAVAPAAARGWTRLGETSVSSRMERNDIRVGFGRGTFRWIKLRVERRSVEFRRITIFYGNGESESVDLRRVVRAGEESRPIRVNHRGRVIRRVEFIHRTASGSHARVLLFGRN